MASFHTMSVFIDRKYLGMVSHKLDLFKQKNTDLFNFRCPYCLDSKKNKTKARGYVYRKGNDYFYRCHNCGMSTTFANFLKEVDQHNYKAYVMERYANGDNGHSPYQKPDLEYLKGNAFRALASTNRPPKIELPSIASLPNGHYAKEYIKNRQIPVDFWKEIYYTEHFKDFMDSSFPEHGKEDIPNDDRIILLYKNVAGFVTNVAGRALSDTKIRYITVKVSDEKKVFGLHRLQTQNRVYIVEGQFDSFFIPNCVASGDSNLGGTAEYLKTLKNCDCVLIFDNEPRNREIVSQIERAIGGGHNVVLFPSSIQQKDVNDMVKAGIDVLKLIEENIYNGPTAKLKFISWRKC